MSDDRKPLDISAVNPADVIASGTRERRLQILGTLLWKPELKTIAEQILRGGTILGRGAYELFRAIKATDEPIPRGALLRRLGKDCRWIAEAIMPDLHGETAPFEELLVRLQEQYADGFETEELLERYALEVREDYNRTRRIRLLTETAQTLKDAPADQQFTVLGELQRSLDDPELGPPNRFARAATSGAALLAATIEKPPSLLGDSLLPATEYGGMYGRPGLLKSRLSTMLALAVSRGDPWFGIPTTKARAAVVSLEVGTYYLRKYLETIAGGGPTDNLLLVAVDALGGLIDLASARQQQEIRAWVRNEGLGLLVIDPLAAAHRGSEMIEDLSPVIAFLKELPAQTGCVPLLIHHEPKGAGGMPIEDDLAAVRGATQLGDFAGLLMRVRRKDGRLCLRFTKTRYAEPPAPLWFDIGPGGIPELTTEPEDRAATKARRLSSIVGLLSETPRGLSTEELYAVIQAEESKGDRKPPSLRTVQGYLRELFEHERIGYEGPPSGPGGRWVAQESRKSTDQNGEMF